MPTLELTTDEADLLREVLAADLSDLRAEVAATDIKNFRDNLKKKEAVMVELLTRLGSG